MPARTVYADNAATTAISQKVLSAMTPFLIENYGNPSSIYSLAAKSRHGIETARVQVAEALNAQAEEIFFTGGGTESDNWAIRSGVLANAKKGKHIITTAIEHPAVLNTCKALKKEGYELTVLGVDALGRVSPEDLRAALREDTALVSVMIANNEIGTIEPIARLAAITKENGALFHTDAVQAAGHVAVDVKKLGVDLLSISGHKFKGPKGVGALFIRKGLRLSPLIIGGGHERGLRSGTENVASIVGMGAALEDACAKLTTSVRYTRKLCKRLIDGVLKIPYTRLTGDPDDRLPGTASFVIEFIEGESMVLMLDGAGISASSGSACSSGSLDPSHVLLALGLPHEVAHGSLRLTINEDNDEEDIDYIAAELPRIVSRLREMSPLWDDKKKG